MVRSTFWLHRKDALEKRHNREALARGSHHTRSHPQNPSPFPTQMQPCIHSIIIQINHRFPPTPPSLSHTQTQTRPAKPPPLPHTRAMNHRPPRVERGDSRERGGRGGQLRGFWGNQPQKGVCDCDCDKNNSENQFKMKCSTR